MQVDVTGQCMYTQPQCRLTSLDSVSTLSHKCRYGCCGTLKENGDPSLKAFNAYSQGNDTVSLFQRIRCDLVRGSVSLSVGLPRGSVCSEDRALSAAHTALMITD